jgi:hypothetical protein
MFEKDVADSLFNSDPGLASDVVKELRTGWKMQAVQAEINTREKLQEAKIKHESKHIDGVGVHRLRVDPTSYHYWGKRLGYECWSNEQFIKEYGRDNPSASVICKPEKPKYGYTKKYSKTFNL